jgi:hypothetical protein
MSHILTQSATYTVHKYGGIIFFRNISWHGVITQKTELFNLLAVRYSNKSDPVCTEGSILIAAVGKAPVLVSQVHK